MEAEFKVVVVATELATAIEHLAEAISNHKAPTTVSGKELEKAIKSATKEAVQEDKNPVEVVEHKKEECHTEKQISMNLPQKTEEIKLADLRALGAKLKAKGVATKQIISDMGFEKLSAVPQEQYAELMMKFEKSLEV